MQVQPTQDDVPQDADKAVRRRSTVREKVSFLFGDAPSPEPSPVPAMTETPAPSQEPQQDTQTESTESNGSPRRAGWWSRRSSE